MKGLARTEKAATRLLALLAGGAAIVEPAARSGLLLVKNDKGAVSIEATLLAGLASEGSITKRGDCISVTQAGLKAAKRNDGSPDSFQRQHREVDTIMIDNGASTSVAEINVSESPLALLMRLKSKDGRPFLSRAEFDAGERLRSDYTRGKHHAAAWRQLGGESGSRAGAGKWRHGGVDRCGAGGAPARRRGAEGGGAGTVGPAR